MKATRETAMRFREWGQGMVEAALFMPIFLILFAGTVEVAQIIIDQNRTSNAARSGARFMANGGKDPDVHLITLDTVSQTVDYDENVWDIWAIRGTVNASGDGFAKWEFNHVYGISNTIKSSEVNETEIQAEVLAELQSDPSAGASAAAGLDIVAAYVLHDVHSLVGLEAIPWLAGYNSVKGLSVMRVVGFHFDAKQGCDAFPIAVHETIYSVNPPGSETNAYPDKGDFQPHSPTPNYGSFKSKGHVPGILLSDLPDEIYEPGHVFKIENGFGEGNFGWLRWNQGRPSDSNTLEDSLVWPGNSKDYTNASNGSGLDGIVCPYWAPTACPYDDGRVYGYVNPRDLTDTSMHVGDWVPANTGNVNSEHVRSSLNQHITSGNSLRFVVWDSSYQNGSYGEYQVKRFAIFKLHGYSLRTDDSWILAEFIKWDTTCGQ